MFFESVFVRQVVILAYFDCEGPGERVLVSMDL